jgi:dipeptidyl-peptidase-4
LREATARSAASRRAREVSVASRLNASSSHAREERKITNIRDLIAKTMIKKSLVLLLAMQMTTFGNIMAQELKTPTLDDLTPGGRTYLTTENIFPLQWWGDKCVTGDYDKLQIVSPETGKVETEITLESVNAKLTAAGKKGFNHLYNAKFLWADQPVMLLTRPGEYLRYNFRTGEIAETLTLPKEAANMDFNAVSGKIAYTIANNLYVNDTQVTDEGEGIVCGQTVHRNEFGINKGTFWSPKGDLLAFYRMDESMVAQYPLVDITKRIGEVNNVRYPMAGMTSHKVQVGIFNPATGKTTFLNTGDPTDRYFTNISWAPDEKKLYLIEVNRDQNDAKLCEYDVESGNLLRTIIEETHEKYVEPCDPIVFLPWNAKQFIYQSQRDGFKHLYLYNLDGTLVKQLTSGNWLVQELKGFDTKRKEAIILSTEDTPLGSSIYRVSIPNGKRTLVGNAKGAHYVKLSTSGDYLTDSRTTAEQPRVINIYRTKDSKSINLLTAKSPYAEYKMPVIETGTIKAADGKTDLYYRLIKPADMDETQKHPAIIYVYGGPHAQVVTDGWAYGARGWELYMANKGYVMFSLDNRGSENRGLEFENATFRHLGVEECKDQVEGAKFLQSLPYVDAERIGVHGWSFGGHMTTALMLRYPEIFKVGVAGGPVIDWKFYEVMYGERYMDTPQSNPEGYDECNLTRYAGNLKGRLMIIHDDHDDTCVPQHTLSFLKACIDARTYPDFFMYPCHKHNVLGIDRVHLQETITRYFEDHL